MSLSASVRRFAVPTLIIVTAFLTQRASAKGFQTGPPEYQVGVGPAFAVTADLRGLNRQDIIVSNPDINNGAGNGNTISVLLNNGDGTYQPAVSYTVGLDPVGIAVADFNRDGHPDLAVANAGSNTVMILLGKGDGTFTAGATINVGVNPVGPIAGDINNDGKIDLVVTNSDLFVSSDNCSKSSVSILLGNGNGTFTSASPATVSAGACPLDAALVDLNGDGKKDLVVVNNGGMQSTTTSNVSVLLGNGNGTFQKAVNYSVGSRPGFVAVADFNKDGKLDLAVANQGAKNSGTNGGISLLLGNGNGTFQAASLVLPGVVTRADNLVAGDFNNDGSVDLAFLGKNNGSGNVSVILGNGNGTFQSPKIVGLSGVNIGLAAGDLDGDGNLDLAVPIDNSPNPGDIAVLLGDGTGHFLNTLATYTFNGSSPQALTVGSFNNDGFADIAVALTNFQNCCPSSDSYEILLGSGFGTFNQLSPVALPFGNATGIAAGFFGTSGHQDLVVSQNGGGGSGTPGISYLASSNNGTFQAPVNTTGITPFQVTKANLNVDGKDDIVLGICAPVETGLSNGDGTFALTQLQQGAATIDCVTGQVASGDFNGDGLPDIVAMIPDATDNKLNAYVYLNQLGAAGTFGAPAIYTIATIAGCNGCAMGAAVGHFVESTAAGHLDIAVTNPLSNQVVILKNKGDGTFSIGQTYAVGTTPQFIAVGDFNGDGHADLAVANCGNCNMSNGAGSSISILYGKGDGTFQAPTAATTYVAGDGSSAIAVGDFNGDGAPDLAVANSIGGSLTILLNTGGNTMSLIPSPASSTVGQSVTFTATQFPSVLSAKVTGTETFKDGAATLGTPAVGANNAASVSTTALTAGVHSISANYSGDGNYNPNSRTISYTVNKGASNTVLNAAPNPAFVGQTVTLTATVSGGGPAPSDGSMVTFMNGAAVIATVPLTSGSASTTTSFTVAQTYSLTAVYGGDANYNPSTSPTVNEVVQLDPTATTVASGTNPSVAGNAVSFTATVTTPFGKPAGNVTFSATGPAAVPSSNGTLNISGVATAQLTFGTAGTYSVTAQYNGDSDHAGSTSALLTQVVNCVGCTATTTSLSAPAVAPTDPGEQAGIVELKQTATFTVTVTANSGANPPTGTVHLQENGVDIMPTQALTAAGATSSTASFSVMNLTIGTHNIIAVYDGDQVTFGGSLSSTVPVQRTPKPHGAAH